MLKAKKYIAFIAAFLFALAFSFSVFFIAAESNHECIGNDCLICEKINTCIHFFDNFTPDPNAAPATLSVCFALVLCIGIAAESKKHISLVSLKVKLSY